MMAISFPPQNTRLEQARLSFLAELITERLSPGQAPDGQWPAIIELANEHGLTPMLLWALKKQIEAADRDPRFKRLVDITSLVMLNYQFQWESQVAIQQVLSQAGIPALWIKGLVLAIRLYPEPYLRPMDDLDVLVPEQHRQKALAVIQGLGFQREEKDALAEKMNPDEQPAFHHALVRREAWPVRLEMHFHLLGNEGTQTLPERQLAWFWQQTETWTQEGTPFTIFKPEAHLLYLCVHAVLQHGEASFRLLRYFDLHLLVTKSELDWQLIVNRAVELRWSYAVERALTLACQYFATPFPAWVLAELKNRRLSDEDTSRVAHLQGEGFRWESTWLQLAPYPPGERLRRLFILLLPPREYMRKRYAIPSSHSVIPYYFYRWWDAGREVARALRQRLRRRLI
jgi:hypothetical protein